MLTIYKGRPENLSGRLDREIRVYDLLDSLGVEYDRLDHEPAMTMEVCAEIDAAFERMPLEAFKADLSADKSKHAIVCKNLFLTNKQHTKYYLLMMPGDKKFLTPGSVSVLGLMNDKENAVQLLIDSDVLRSEYVGCHPCMNTSSLRMLVKDLTEKILPAIHHEAIVVNL